jgi:magnesium-transporting ATPase (P-type)
MLKLKRPTTKLGKASLMLIAMTFVAWLFVNNAQNCLSRDFVEQAPPAICWRATNDYESTIAYSQVIYLGLLALAIICSSASISRLKIKHSHATSAEHKKIAWFLVALSILLLTFVVTTFEVWQRTTFNNNNYFLNTTTDAVVKIGVPLWLAIATAAITYGLSYFKKRNRHLA